MLTVWANDSKHTVVRPYTLSCVISNKWNLDTRCKSFVVLAHINDSSSLHCTENFGLVVTLVLWSVLKLSAVDSALPFLSLLWLFHLADPCTDFDGFSHAFCWQIYLYTAAFLTTGSSGGVEVNNWMWKHLFLSVGKTQVAIFYR